MHHGLQHSPNCLRLINQMAGELETVTTEVSFLNCVFMPVSAGDSYIGGISDRTHKTH